MDALHVIAGVLLQLAGVALWRVHGLASLRPWLAVLALTLLNELHDLWVEQWPSPAMQVGEGIKDVVLTLFLPTVLLLIARASPTFLLANPDGRPD
jgi:hypothetical protein